MDDLDVHMAMKGIFLNATLRAERISNNFTWMSTSVLCCKACQITNTKAYVFSDSVLCVGKMEEDPSARLWVFSPTRMGGGGGADSFLGPVQYRPVRPTLDPSRYREIQHRVGETVPIVESSAKIRGLQAWERCVRPTDHFNQPKHPWWTLRRPCANVFLLAGHDVSALEPWQERFPRKVRLHECNAHQRPVCTLSFRCPWVCICHPAWRNSHAQIGLSAPKVSLLPNRIWQSARIVRDCSSTAWIARSAGLDAELYFGVVWNFTRSPAMFFTLFARATVAGSPSHLNRTCLWKNPSMNLIRIVSGLFSQNRNDFDEKQVSVDSNESRGIFLFCFSTGRRCLHGCEVKCDHMELFSLLAQVTTEMWVIFPTSQWHIAHTTAQAVSGSPCGVVVPLEKVELDQGGSLVSPVL